MLIYAIQDRITKNIIASAFSENVCKDYCTCNKLIDVDIVGKKIRAREIPRSLENLAYKIKHLSSSTLCPGLVAQGLFFIFFS